MSAATQYDAFIRVAEARYELRKPLVWEIGQAGSGWFLEIPAGFTFDISIPWYLRWLVSQHHRPWFLASSIHDYLLENGYDVAFAAGEWYRAAKAKAKEDNHANLVKAAYFGIAGWTVL